MKAYLKNANCSPKKANLVAGMVRGESVKNALARLKFTPKKAALILYKVIASAAANAKNNFDQSGDNLVIKEILINKGMILKRGMPVSRGRQHPILKRKTNISVTVGIEGSTESPMPSKKTAMKPDAAATEGAEKNTTKKKPAAKKVKKEKKS